MLVNIDHNIIKYLCSIAPEFQTQLWRNVDIPLQKREYVHYLLIF